MVTEAFQFSWLKLADVYHTDTKLGSKLPWRFQRNWKFWLSVLRKAKGCYFLRYPSSSVPPTSTPKYIILVNNLHPNQTSLFVFLTSYFNLIICIINLFDQNQGGWELDESKKEAAVRETIEEAGVRGIVGVSHSPHYTHFLFVYSVKFWLLRLCLVLTFRVN